MIGSLLYRVAEDIICKVFREIYTQGRYRWGGGWGWGFLPVRTGDIPDRLKRGVGHFLFILPVCAKWS